MEDIGIEGRGAFYDETGALLDVVQNHIMQMVALICMDAPFNMDAGCISDQKEKVLKKVRISQDARDVVRGQYDGYTREENVNPKSGTETFVGLKLFVDTPAFKGVPIYIRTGKKLDRRYTDVIVQFKQDSVHFLGSKAHGTQANVLSIRVQPEESISLRIMVREPGFEMALQPAQMDFCYQGGDGSSNGGSYSPSAYEKVMYDALHGDQLSLVRSDVLMQQWRIVDSLKAKWHSYKLEVYAQGSEGPASQHALVARDGTKWWSEAMPYCPVPQKK
jgi:glucose-6-phosphate 1-dehydrogenase